MSKKNDGGSAFPTPHLIAMNGEVVNTGATGGMSLRDYFAAKAMASLVTTDAWDDPDGKRADNPNTIAVVAYDIADAMLTARDGGGS